MCRNLHILKQNFLKFEKNRAEEKIGLPIPKIRYPRVISTALVTLDGMVMVSTYVHSEGSETVKVFVVAVVDEYMLSVNSRFWSDVVQPKAKSPSL